jgi:hypothetical protein
MLPGQKRLWLRVERGRDGEPIARLANGKAVLFKKHPQRQLPPIGLLADVVIMEEFDNKCIGEWTGAFKR